MRRAPLHLAHAPGDDPGDLEVVASYEHAGGFFEIASDLWRVAGRDDRGIAIAQTLTLAYRYEPAHLDRTAIATLLEQLGGLEEALVAAGIAADLRLTLAQVSDLRARSTEFDLAASRGDSAMAALQEAMVYVDAARAILSEALALEVEIYFD